MSGADDKTDIFSANSGRNLEITVGDETYLRLPIKTHFVTVGEDHLELLKTYVAPHIQSGDLLVMGEKVVALCQERVMYLKDMKVSWLAKFLSGFATVNPAGPAMDNVYKMQAAINLRGAVTTFVFAVIAGLAKLFGKKGVFYRLMGREVAGIDGFCVVGFEYYADKGILSPENPDGVCDQVKEVWGIDCMIVDANDLGIEILGKNSDMPYSDDFLTAVIKDNPAGQKREQTPFVLVRAVKEEQQEQ